MPITRKLQRPLPYRIGTVEIATLMPPADVVMEGPPDSYLTTVMVAGQEITVQSIRLLRALAAVPCLHLDEHIWRTSFGPGWTAYCERAGDDQHPEKFCQGDMLRCPWPGIRAQAQLHKGAKR